MKARKTLAHHMLISAVTEQLIARFSPDPDFLRKRIEALISDGYLKRDDNDRRKYEYCA